MIYNIVSPFRYEISGDSQIDAIKQFIKINYELNINRMIIQDRQRHMQANFNYYKQNGQNKVGIDMYPVNYLPIINNSNTPYNIILGLKNSNKESAKEETTATDNKEDNKEDDDKKVAYKIIVPQLGPILPPGPLRLPNYLPTVYNVYKNDNNQISDTKILLPLLPQQPYYPR